MGHRALVALIATACAHQPMLLGEPIPKGCTGKGITESDRCMGWFLDRFLMVGRVEYDDSAVMAYVQRVGGRLVRAHGDRERWAFRVLDDDQVRAYSSVARVVYVTRGALLRLRSEAELAGLLGHEIGHVLAGHAREDVRELGREISRSPDDADDLRAERDDEIQADALAVRLTARAGYDPAAVETMLRALGAGHSGTEDPEGVHPGIAERVTRLHLFASRFTGGERGEESYRAHMATLSPPSDPRTITVVANTVVFARSNLAIELPPIKTVELDNGAATLVLESGITVDLRRIAPQLAPFMATPKPGAEIANVPRVLGKHAVLITVLGPDAAAIALALRAHVRTPRPDELARARARVIDFTAPRKLWPD